MLFNPPADIVSVRAVCMARTDVLAREISGNLKVWKRSDSMQKHTKARMCVEMWLYLRFQGVLHRCGHFGIVV